MLFLSQNVLRRLSTPSRIFLRPFMRSSTKGMSLIEILIVISLIGVLMTYIVTQLTTRQDEALRDTARLGMGNIAQALQLFRVHNMRYPTTDQGLDALLRNPGTDARWRGPYIDENKLNDPWGNKFEYESDGKDFKIISRGANTSDASDDIFYPDNKPGDKP